MSNSQRPLLKSVASAYERHKSACHPGLWLDKAAAPPRKQEDSIPDDQKGSKPDLTEVIRLTRAAKTMYVQLYAQLLADRRSWLERSGAVTLSLRTSGLLALHLARASALENAGVCLHPVYGFACLPGSGLKGLAHAFACEHWLPAQAGKQTAWQEICAVFGWAPSPWLRELAKRHGVEPPENQSAGAILFHDAWPAEWPELILDIVNSHHSQYYGAADNNVPPPGDWENPIPVYFPAIKPGVAFHFPLQPREAFAAERAEEARRLLGLARQWLASGLYHLGAGAKTNAGYGRFEKPAESEAITIHSLSPQTATFECELELVTPAFLAGASQTAEDCDLRPATLRGLLRWWWRTMHSHALAPSVLKKLESAIWGSSESGGAVSIKVVRLTEIASQECLLLDKPEIARRHKLPQPPDKKTTQGASYLAFGMDDNVRERPGSPPTRRQRYWLSPLHRWKISLIVRKAQFNGLEIHAQEVMEQARLSLQLMVNFGGAGSKAGKGWGSLSCRPLSQEPQQLINLIKRHSAEFRKKISIDIGRYSNSDTPALEYCLPPLEISSKCQNPWLAVDWLGASYQSFCKKHKHQAKKRSLGLPRRIGEPVSGDFTPSGELGKIWKNANPKQKAEIRHPSPFRFHFDRNDKGELILRALFIPSSVLPDIESSKEILSDLKKHLETALSEEIKKYPLPGNPPTPPAPITAKSQPLQPTAAPVERDPVEELLKKHPPQRFPASSKGTHQQLIKSLESFEKEHPQRITEACQKYRDAIYPNPKEDKSFKKDPLFQFLIQRAPRIV